MIMLNTHMRGLFVRSPGSRSGPIGTLKRHLAGEEDELDSESVDDEEDSGTSGMPEYPNSPDSDCSVCSYPNTPDSDCLHNTPSPDSCIALTPKRQRVDKSSEASAEKPLKSVVPLKSDLLEQAQLVVVKAASHNKSKAASSKAASRKKSKAAKTKSRAASSKSVVQEHPVVEQSWENQKELIKMLRKELRQGGEPLGEEVEEESVRVTPKTEHGSSFFQVNHGKLAVAQASVGHFHHQARVCAEVLRVLYCEGWSKVQLNDAKVAVRKALF